MKVLLVAEGKHELGGALETLVRRLSPLALEVEHDRVSNDKIHAHHGKGQGFFKRAVRWILEARKRGYEALVLVVDEDGHRERVKELDDAQEYSGIEFRRALGIAIRTFDAWMLADEEALTSVLEYPVQRQPSPETVRDPKEVCKQLLAASTIGIPQAEMYNRLAQAITFRLLKERCAKGFAPFAERVRSLVIVE
jgi:hypothetical protein